MIEGACIHLDGLNQHLHGNPETAERDREIRTWPRNTGYEVIEIATIELDGVDAMVMHFQRLAVYLGNRDLSGSKADTVALMRLDEELDLFGKEATVR